MAVNMQCPLTLQALAMTIYPRIRCVQYTPKRLTYSRYLYQRKQPQQPNKHPLQIQLHQQLQPPQQHNYRNVTNRSSSSGSGGGSGGGMGGSQTALSVFKSYMHNWKRQMDYHDRRRKIIPKLVYLHNPWKYFLTKMNLWKLQLLWDNDFMEEEFIRGSKQAAIVMTNIIRTQNANKISMYTTPIGFQQITRDMLLSRNDSRLKLVIFELEHLRKAIPMKVVTRSNYGRKYCFIDMLFVGLRNTKDFNTPEEVVEVNEMLRKLDADMKTPFDVLAVPHRIVFAEIFMRFRRDYTADAANGAGGVSAGTATGTADSATPPLGPKRIIKVDDKDWSVSFYKILSFDVLNYDPQK